jgi:hypothetical protein
MFRLATPQNTRRARPQVGNITALTLPSKGMNARDTFAAMGPEFAISLVNVIVEPYGLKTRKGYTEWATNFPSAAPVWTVMNYYPATAVPVTLALPFPRSNFTRLIIEPRADPLPPAGKLFAAQGGQIYDVTAGGGGPWIAQAGVVGPTDFWTWLNFQNLAGSFLCITNDGGGYAIYNGVSWSMPTQGAGIGQINGVNPALFAFVASFKKRLWFVEKNSTRAWYLPVSQITGTVTQFNFGEQFRKGGHLVALANWTVDGGEGIDDYLVAISSQGDVVVYKGVDPDDATQFALHGVWDVGALPVGRRSVTQTGGDVFILSQFGVTPLSVLLSASALGAIEEKRMTYLIAPLIARLMRDYATFPGWQFRMVQKEELALIGVPLEAPQFGGQFFVLKTTSGAWSVLKNLPYVSTANIDAACFAGTRDGRVVRAFDGNVDNVHLNEAAGTAIQCQVTPAYQPMGMPGQQKVFKLVRPTFITTLTPTLTLQILTDYGLPKPTVTPTLPNLAQSLWNVDKWDEGVWSGVQQPIKEWLGCQGVGFVGTVQLDYSGQSNCLLASIDFWTEQGGVM